VQAALPPAFAPKPRLGALLAVVAGWVAVTVVVSALVAPPLFWLVEEVSPGSHSFQRVLRRVAMLVAIAALAVFRRRLGVSSLAEIGLAWSRERGRACGAALVAGVVSIGLAAGVELRLGTRVRGGALTAGEAAETVVGAGLVGVVEEGLLRGAFLFPFGRLAGAGFWSANAAVSALYATAHFARGGGRDAEVGWGSGWAVWAALPRAAAEHGEAWLGLFATGALFYVLAWRQGHAWGAAGLHAGAVLALQVVGETSDPVAGGRSLLLVDGLLPGYGVALLAALAAAVLALRAPRSTA